MNQNTSVSKNLCVVSVCFVCLYSVFQNFRYKLREMVLYIEIKRHITIVFLTLSLLIFPHFVFFTNYFYIYNCRPTAICSKLNKSYQDVPT